MKQYTELTDKQFTKDIINSAPKQVKSWLNFDEEVHDKETMIPSAIALTIQYPYCIEVYIQ